MYTYEEEDTCHASNLAQIDMRRRIHVIRGGGYMSYEEEDTCHMRRRIRVLRPILHTQICPWRPSNKSTYVNNTFLCSEIFLWDMPRGAKPQVDLVKH